jgi:hypothetical protein
VIIFIAADLGPEIDGDNSAMNNNNNNNNLLYAGYLYLYS